jgi:hypothetical protein
MGNIKVKKSIEISFDKVDTDSSKDIATEMRQKILDFFKKNPGGIVNLRFGGYARMSNEFAKELFDNQDMADRLDQIVVFGMHVFDQAKFNGIYE